MSRFSRHPIRREPRHGPGISGPESGSVSSPPPNETTPRSVTPVPDAKGAKYERLWFYVFLAIGIVVFMALIFVQSDAGPSLGERAVAGLTACITLALGVWVKGIRER